MLLDHGTAQAQPQTHAFELGREERCEQLFGDLGRDSPTGVRDRELQPSVRMGGTLARLRASHAQFEQAACLGFIVHRLHGVAGQIQQHLLDHGPVTP